jgi:hypothetical protein
MKKPQHKKSEPVEKQESAAPEWPKSARVARVRQPRNTRLMIVDMGEGETLMCQVRDNRFYRANEKLMVNWVGDGTFVDAKPKTNPLLRGGQE